MKKFRVKGYTKIALFILLISTNLLGSVNFKEHTENNKKIFSLENEKLKYSIYFENEMLLKDILETKPKWMKEFKNDPFIIETDADFSLDIMWTQWRAPGKVNNADNPVEITKRYFTLERHNLKELENGAKELDLLFKGIDIPLLLRMTYKLEVDVFYLRRKVAVRDTVYGLHFLQTIYPLNGLVSGNISVVKGGSFGQPIAFLYKDGGAFFGLEYPTSNNLLISTQNGKTMVQCGQEIGEKIGKNWVESEWAVEGLSPNSYIKYWFFKYVDDIRVSKLKPFTLYNSWYDLRSPVMVEDSAHVMNEKNIMRITEKFRGNMIEKYGISLDAFVLDDGWDVYKSDWVLRKKEFPKGLKPIATELKKTNTNLGMWLGPIGGYSHRDLRVGWMAEHGYEVVGDQLCVAGKNYSELLKKRTLDFVENEGVTYFKWDGIQFSCNEVDHGHHVGIYSRRAVMETVIDLCQSVRGKNPNIFLNITSGTWLSPWWVKYANQIWMQGYDYGYAEIPSISRRDGAITYRDYVLFDDFKIKDLWFPISNLMTHGIIKGHLQMLGGEEEPLDKFTDNALLYFARGVSMWELYISPDILTDGEWNAIAKSIHWAKDRFPILSNTEMIGGNPKDREAYGYAHFKGNRGIIAARNPFIVPKKLKVELTPSEGLNPDATSLVVERVYPTRWISPRLFKAGESIEVHLDGYETAIYEIYTLTESSVPLLAGVIFDVVKPNGREYTLKFYNGTEDAKILNPKKVKSIEYEGKNINLDELSISTETQSKSVPDYSVKCADGKKCLEIDVNFTIHESSHNTTLAILLEPDLNSMGKDLLELAFLLDDKEVKAKSEKQKGLWAWYKIDVMPGEHLSRITITPAEKKNGWTGNASIWIISFQEQKIKEISFELKREVKLRPMPPKPWKIGEIKRNVKLGDVKVEI